MQSAKKFQHTTLSMDARQGASRKNEAQENSAVVEPMIVQLDFNKKRAQGKYSVNKKTCKATSFQSVPQNSKSRRREQTAAEESP